ncbi:60s acidic ribosomal protein P2 [Tilletia horrida]|nr:60s acidic ribosomal protein P2 [Tilletia horrida]
MEPTDFGWGRVHHGGPHHTRGVRAAWDASIPISSTDTVLCNRTQSSDSPAFSLYSLSATYAALILADDGLEVTADKLNAILGAAGVSLQPIWATLLAKALADKDIKSLLTNVGGGSGPAVAVSAAPAGGAAPAEAAKEEEKKEEEKEESDDDMGFGLFD